MYCCQDTSSNSPKKEATRFSRVQQQNLYGRAKDQVTLKEHSGGFKKKEQLGGFALHDIKTCFIAVTSY